MTKKQITAVKKTVKMWEWFVNNPTKDKTDYFREHKIRGRRPICECYLCSMWYYKCYGHTSGCPLDAPGLVCNVASDNPFEEWERYQEYGDQKDAKIQAQRIVNACNRWLRKYDR
ncbi:MAG: hypothetical protein KAS32_15090 [Candidatus Peribacteraceae bacterium]|nr:hypothetical protein [Candidatus Peribacteraceae bacterium]